MKGGGAKKKGKDDVRFDPLGSSAAAEQKSKQQQQSGGRKSSRPGDEGLEIETNLLGETFYICKAAVGCTYRAKSKINARDHVNSQHLKKLIRCNQCPMAYLRFKGYQEHFVRHHQKSAYACTFQDCDYKNYVADEMVEHYKVKHETDEVPEAYRPIDPSIPPALAGTADSKPFKKNSVCGLSEESKQLQAQDRKFILSQAILLKNPETGKIANYKCSECGLETTKAQGFVSHYKSKHGAAAHQLEKCPLCDLESKWPSYIRTHLIKVHKAKIQ